MKSTQRKTKAAPAEMKMKNIIHLLSKFCAYQERTAGQVKERLKKYSLTADQGRRIMDQLVKEGFLNEERYARTYALGKFRQNKWGHMKISYSLKAKGIHSDLIDQAIQQIETEEYRALAKKLIARKINEIKDKDPFLRNQKILRYMVMKGFETSLVQEILHSRDV